MYNEPENTTTFRHGEGIPVITEAAEDRIEALKSLATLLLREVDSLKDVLSFRNFGSIQQIDQGINLSNELDRYEIEMIRQAMQRSRGNQRAAAAILGTKVTTLHAKIKRYGVEKFAALSKL